MDLFLLYLNAFLRPILSIDLTLGGATDAVVEVYDWVAILLFGVLGLSFVASAAMRKRILVTEIDLAVGGFVVWCVAVSLIYIDKVYAREVIKLIFPLLVYVVTKNVLRNAEQYRKMLFLMVAAFTIPVVASVVLILLGKGVDYVNYWTHNPRYQGAYHGAHNFGHNMVLLLMLITVYVTVCRYAGGNQASVVARWRKLYLAVMAVSAFFCLALSQTRTQLLGFVVFISYYLFVFHRRAFYIASAMATVLAIAFAPVLMKTLFQDFDKVATGVWREEEMASGRPRIWNQNLTILESMPIDRQLAGVGIGNKVSFGSTEGVVDSHNDYLEVLMHTGVVGLLLYLLMQLLMIRKILRLPGRDKHVFLGVFMAVVVMNLASNSYITRSAIAQVLFLILAYIELPSATRADLSNDATKRNHAIAAIRR